MVYKITNKLLFLHLVGCSYYWISNYLTTILLEDWKNYRIWKRWTVSFLSTRLGTKPTDTLIISVT